MGWEISIVFELDNVNSNRSKKYNFSPHLLRPSQFRFISSMWLARAFFLVIIASLGWSTPVDNGVEGPPEIVCGTGSVTVSFNTRNPFEGHLYVKNHFSTPGCRTDTPITNGGKLVAAIELPFDKCSVTRTRSLNPKGVFVSAVLIISFHRYFETKVDRAYNIQCFYMVSLNCAPLLITNITTRVEVFKPCY